MPNVIAITAYNKPDLLYLYLEQLYSCPSIVNYMVNIYTETGYDPDENVVVAHYRSLRPDVSISLRVRKKHPTCPLVGYHNILTSYLDAADESDEYVILGEEDMLPTKDYIRFNDYVYRQFLSKYERIFCAAHKRRQEAELTGHPEVLIGDYQVTSPSVVSVKAINKYLRPFLKMPGYFEDPVEFNWDYFPNSGAAPFHHTHHDGAIGRIMEHCKLFAVKPDQARSMHVGLSGIECKGRPPRGTLVGKVAQWRELLKDGDKIRALSYSPHSIVVTNPEGPNWEKLVLDTNRRLATASSWWFDPLNEFAEYIKHGATVSVPVMHTPAKTTATLRTKLARQLIRFCPFGRGRALVARIFLHNGRRVAGITVRSKSLRNTKCLS